jgi:predicted O-methyltransferase YrrM
VDETSWQQVRELMRRGEQSAWTTAALALTLARSASPDLAEAAAEVVRAAGVGLPEDPGDDASRAHAAAQAAAPLLQTARLLDGAATWAEQSDEALLAQGRASAQMAPMFVEAGLPHLPGLAEALDAPGARMLDVGTGVGALAEGFALAFPRLSVTGLDVMPRVLELARHRMTDSPVRERVELRRQDVATLDEPDAYDFAWLPAPFLPQHALEAGVRAVTRALRPGGWLMVGHAKTTGDRLDDALDRLKTLAFGGTLLDGAVAQRLLEEHGLGEVSTMPTPPGAPRDHGGPAARGRPTGLVRPR